MRAVLIWAAGLLLLALSARGVEAQVPELAGVVTFNGVGVPGVTVTAVRGGTRVATTTDLQGFYRLRGLDTGTWTITTALVGFAPSTVDVTIPPTAPVPPLILTLLPLADVMPLARVVRAEPTAAAASTSSSGSPRPAESRPGGAPTGAAAAGPRDTAAPSPGARGPQPTAPAGDASDDAASGAADGFLINGSVNNGSLSPFAQARAFGNNRPGGRSLYTGGFGVLSSNSALDARPYTFGGAQTPRPEYNDVQIIGNVGGPLRLPRVRNDPTAFLSVQYIRDHGTTVQSALVPTAAERAGDFSQSLDRTGQPVRLVDPRTGLPFEGNVLPSQRITPQAASLLGYYPQPNADGSGGFNYQVPIIVFTRQQSVQSRLTQVLTTRDQLNGSFSYVGTETENGNLFGFVDTTRGSTADATLNWSHRVSQFSFLRARYQSTRVASNVTPYFANRVNVSGDAGITGNDQDPTNWGPPALSFASGTAGLSTAIYARNVTWTNGGTAELLRTRGRHNMTFGAGARAVHLNVLSQQDPRGGFAFTGGASGSDVADFLLGLPASSTIAFGNADKRLRQWVGEAFVNDDWRLSAALTLNVGLRWEFETPMTEGQGRLANLDVAPDFADVQAQTPSDGQGPVSGEAYPSSLVRFDARGLMPRLGVAWRPVPGSSLVVRGGYGRYRNTNVYQSLALLLAQQPPFSTTASVASTAATPLTLANGFAAAATATYGTFGVEPDLRVGVAENWQVSAQRDLPASLTITGTYLGSRGHRLMQQFLPNTYPVGAVNPCPTCPTGFTYLTSTGRSVRNAGQLQVRRRLRNGFTATVQYTLAKATDDAAAFAGATLAGSSIAQNWLDLDAESGRSSFDQRHLVTVQAQYTTGAGIAGGTLVDGVRGRLLKDWTFVGQLTTGSGLPVTPLYLSPVPGTGVSDNQRPRLTGAAVDDIPVGAYMNPAAYAAPAPGQWGDAGRNSVTGPAQFSFNAAVGRTFRWGSRFNVDWRIDATNVLNTVTYSAVNTFVGSPQFGLPNRANQMRRLQSSLRVRF